MSHSYFQGCCAEAAQRKVQQQLLCISLVGGKKHKALLSAKFLSSNTDIFSKNDENDKHLL